MAVEGTLDLFKLPEILQLISQQKKTGILTVQGQQDIVAISFLNGRIVAADALSQTLEEGLAQVLVREGMITPSDLHRAAGEHQSAGGRLIDVLVERRYLERAQLLQALRLQTWRLLEQLLRWNEGDFKFYSGDEVSFEEGFNPIAVEELLIHAAPATTAAPSPPPRPAPPPPAPATPAAVPRALAPAPVAPPPVVPDPRFAPRPAPPVAPPPAAPLAPVVPFGEETGQFRQMRIEPKTLVPLGVPWGGRILFLLLTLLAAGALWLAPDSLIMPFSWQQRERTTLARDQRAALYLKIDRAAKTWFLLKGSFPDRLEDLVKAALLSPADLKDPEGRPLRYTAGEESYTLQPLEGGKPVPGTEATEAITGNFLLDPEVLNVAPESKAAPLVLLD
jgi:hypothetical protein